MKRLLAILLIIAMLVPLCLTAQAESVKKKGFYLVNWGDLRDGNADVIDDFTNTYYMPYIWTNSDKLKKGETYTFASKIGGSGTGEAGAKTIAASVKKWFDENDYPEGARYINFTLPATAINHLNEYCFVGHTVPIVSEWMEAFCKEFKALGGVLDGVTVDVEFLGIYANYISGGGDGVDFSAKKDPLLYKKIVEHPEYKEKIRPMLEERGFKFYSPVTDNTPEIYGISGKAGSEYSTCASIWNAVMRNYLRNTVTEGCAPMWKYYPDAVLSDYTSKNADPWVKEMDDKGGANAGSGGSYTTVGNSSNDNFYSVRPSTSFFKDSNGAVTYPTIPGYNNAVYSNTPFNKFLFEMNVGKNTYQAADADENGRKQVSWWLAHAYYGSAAHTAYWSETVLHLCMLDPQIFLGYILTQDCKTNGTEDIKKYTNALLITDQLLSMASDLVGYTDIKPLDVNHNWNYPFVLSGAYANGRNVYRISPDTTDMKLEDFQVAGAKDPTFTAEGITVTFPGGKIIADKEVYDIGTCGFWVETAKDVYPIITKADNYNEEYAAYQETFEQYDVGTEYNYNNARPEYVWEPKKQGTASATVVADPTDSAKKMLAVTGNYEFKNVKLPDNILGGDTYAKHQAWEISFILPEDLSAEAELQLLYAIHSKNKFKDQGIKIAGGKVYYDNAGELVELEGVTLSAGVRYTVVREFDFSDAETYNCRYYIYDAEGKELGKTGKVRTPEKWEIPITTVAYATKQVTGNAVLFDNYRLYTTKVNSDFYLYDAKTGVPVATADMTTPREKATAYRFSWLNSTDTEKSYTLMAAYYDGETKVSEEAVQEMKLAPYENGAFYGEIENKQAGKTMLLYVKDNNPIEELTVLEKSVTVTVNKDDVALREGPGTNYAQVGTAANGQKLTVTETVPGVGCTWGKVEGGWIVLEDTDFYTIPVDDIQQDDEGLDATTIIIIAAAAAAVVIAVVVIVIVASAKKKKKAANAPAEKAAEEIVEENNEE